MTVLEYIYFCKLNHSALLVTLSCKSLMVYCVCNVRLIPLTNCGEDIGKAEVVHSVEREEMVEELLLLIITAQESIALIEFPSKKQPNTLNHTVQI